MTPAELQDAIQRFEAAGGQVEQVETGERRHIKKACRPLRVATREEINTIHRMADQGLAAAAKAVHMSTRTVSRIAHQEGIEFTTWSPETMRALRKAEQAMAPQIRRLARQQMPQEAIAATLGLGRGRLRRIAAEHHIEMNSRPGRT